MSPSQPWSARLAEKSSVTPAGSSIRARTNPDVHSFSRNLRAVERSSSCSWLNPKSMGLVLGKAEHALGDDVLLDLGRPALDRVGAGAEERVGPHAALDRPVRALHELRVRPFDLHRDLLQPLMRVDPRHLA